MWIDEDALRQKLSKVFDGGVLAGVIGTLIVLTACGFVSWVVWHGVG